jgi:hypothetical protein
LKLEYVKFVEVDDVERIHDDALRVGRVATLLKRQ